MTLPTYAGVFNTASRTASWRPARMADELAGYFLSIEEGAGRWKYHGQGGRLRA